MKKNVVFISLIVFFLLIIIGTLAYVHYYKDYDSKTNCLVISYGIGNQISVKRIQSEIHPSATIKEGLKAGVKIKLKESCLSTGTSARIKLHINKDTDPYLTTVTPSYCKIDTTKNRELTKASCYRASGTWYGNNDYYCENAQTLERMGKYTTYNNCVRGTGIWTTAKSPLRYAVYDTDNENSLPYTVGKIMTEDIGKDIILSDDMIIRDSEKQYYVYIWLDKNVTDSTYDGLTIDASLIVEEIE